MAKQTSEDRDAAKGAAADAAGDPAQNAADARALIKMVKAGQEPLHVHPTTVEAHKTAGWKEA